MFAHPKIGNPNGMWEIRFSTVWVIHRASHRKLPPLDGQHLEIHLRGLDLLTVPGEFVLHLAGTKA